MIRRIGTWEYELCYMKWTNATTSNLSSKGSWTSCRLQIRMTLHEQYESNRLMGARNPLAPYWPLLGFRENSWIMTLHDSY